MNTKDFLRLGVPLGEATRRATDFVAKFILGGGLILVAIVYLIFSSTQASAEYFMTVDELKAKGPAAVGQNLRVSGAVIGSTINYDPKAMLLSFEVAQVPGDNATVE